MSRNSWQGWAAAILVVATVVVWVTAGLLWAVVMVGAAWFVKSVVSEVRRPPAPPKPLSPPPCGGIGGGCPVCLAASVALGVVVGDWLSGD